MRFLALSLACLSSCRNPPTAIAVLEANGDSQQPTISDDGKFVVFESRASNFVADDQPETWDVFLCERATGRVKRLSDGDSLPARSPIISGDGRWIVYLQARSSRETRPGAWKPTEYPWEVALVDRLDDSVRWLGETEPTYELNSPPTPPTISREGWRVAFVVREGEATAIDCCDLRTSTRERFSAPKENGNWPDGLDDPFLSASGKFLVFNAAAEDMDLPIPAEGSGLDYGDEPHIFRRELGTGRTEFVSNLAIASIGYGDYYEPRISDDGRYVAYNHYDQRWTVNPHVAFVSDLEQRTAGRLVPPDPQVAWHGCMLISWLSSDGRRVLVNSHGQYIPILAPGSGPLQVVLRDLEASTWTLVSRTPTGLPGNGPSSSGTAANDLSVIAYASNATNLVANDLNGCCDIFLFEPRTGHTTRVVPGGP